MSIIISIFLHIACLVLYIMNAFIQHRKSFKIVWSIGALTWGILIVLDIIKILRITQ